MQQTEKLARQHQVYHQALWALLQQSEILLAQGYVQAAYELHDSAFRLIEEQKLHQVPLHEFLLRLHAQVLWCWNLLDAAEECAYKGIHVLGNIDPLKHLHSYSMLTRIAIGKGELDKAEKLIEQIELRLQQSTFHLDWTVMHPCHYCFTGRREMIKIPSQYGWKMPPVRLKPKPFPSASVA